MQQVCDPDSPAGKWIAHIDLVEDGTKLKARHGHRDCRHTARTLIQLVGRLPRVWRAQRALSLLSPASSSAQCPDPPQLEHHDEEGACGEECRTISKACEDTIGAPPRILQMPPLWPPPTARCWRSRAPNPAAPTPAGYHDTDLAETLFGQDLNRIALEKLLCRELSKDCSKPTPPLPAGAPRGARTWRRRQGGSHSPQPRGTGAGGQLARDSPRVAICPSAEQAGSRVRGSSPNLRRSGTSTSSRPRWGALFSRRARGWPANYQEIRRHLSRGGASPRARRDVPGKISLYSREDMVRAAARCACDAALRAGPRARRESGHSSGAPRRVARAGGGVFGYWGASPVWGRRREGRGRRRRDVQHGLPGGRRRAAARFCFRSSALFGIQGHAATKAADARFAGGKKQAAKAREVGALEAVASFVSEVATGAREARRGVQPLCARPLRPDSLSSLAARVTDCGFCG